MRPDTWRFAFQGQYINIIVQVTRDLVPVVYSNWALPVEGFQLGVTDIDFSQFTQLAQRQKIDLDSFTGGLTATSPAADWHAAIVASMASLEQVLAVLPNHLGVNLEVRYTTKHDARRLNFNHNVDGNDYVDAVLRAVYEAGKIPERNRKIVFSAFDPVIASFLNFKQPNYAVFFSSYCGLARTRPAGSEKLIPIELEEEDDKRCLSVREAVKFAKANNLLGVMLDATLIVRRSRCLLSEAYVDLMPFILTGPGPSPHLLHQGVGSDPCCLRRPRPVVHGQDHVPRLLRQASVNRRLAIR